MPSDNDTQTRDESEKDWISELVSSLSTTHKNTLIAARELMFDIHSIYPHATFPKTYIGYDFLGTEIALVWYEDAIIKVVPTSIHSKKRMN